MSLKETLQTHYPTVARLVGALAKRIKAKPVCVCCGGNPEQGVVCRSCRFGTEGFAAMASILALVLMTVIAVSMMNLSLDERWASSAVLHGSQAFYAADAGLNMAQATFVDPKLEPGDSIVGPWVSLGNQTSYRIRTMRVDGGPLWTDGFYMLRADGRVRGNFASTRLALFIQVGRESAGIPVPAALSAPAGLVKHGNSGTLSGYDDGTCGSDSLPGIYTSGEVETSGPDTLLIEGNPPILVSTDPVMSWDDVLAIEPTHVIDPDLWDWDPVMFDAEQAPVVFVDGSADLNSGESGRGVLIVNGSLTTNGSWTWEGLILVGDGWTSNGNNTLEGAALVGLRDPSSGIDLGNGTKTFQYNSCNVMLAQRAAGPQTTHVVKWIPLF